MIKPNIFMRIWDMMGISWRYHWPSACSKSYVFYQHPVFWGQSLIIYRWGISDIGGGCWVPHNIKKDGEMNDSKKNNDSDNECLPPAIKRGVLENPAV